MTVQIHFQSTDKKDIEITYLYWLHDEENKPLAKVTEIAEKFNLTRTQVTNIAKASARVKIKNKTCISCDEKPVVKTRSQYSGLIHNSKWQCGSCIQAKHDEAILNDREILSSLLENKLDDKILLNDIPTLLQIKLLALIQHSGIHDEYIIAPIDCKGLLAPQYKMNIEAILELSNAGLIGVSPSSDLSSYTIDEPGQSNNGVRSYGKINHPYASFFPAPYSLSSEFTEEGSKGPSKLRYRHGEVRYEITCFIEDMDTVEMTRRASIEDIYKVLYQRVMSEAFIEDHKALLTSLSRAIVKHELLSALEWLINSFDLEVNFGPRVNSLIDLLMDQYSPSMILTMLHHGVKSANDFYNKRRVTSLHASNTIPANIEWYLNEVREGSKRIPCSLYPKDLPRSSLSVLVLDDIFGIDGGVLKNTFKDAIGSVPTCSGD